MLMVNQLIGFGVVSGSTANPSYANPCGTGDRSALITISSVAAIDFATIAKAIDGVTTDASGYAYTASQSVSGLVMMKLYFNGLSKVINEVTIEVNSGGGGSVGAWKLQGSNDDSGWTDVGTSISPGGIVDLVDSTCSANITGWLYYRYLGLSGTTASSNRTVVDEVKLKIDDA